MVLFELLQLARVFLYYLLIEYLWHAFIMPLTNRNGITWLTVFLQGVGIRLSEDLERLDQRRLGQLGRRRNRRRAVRGRQASGSRWARKGRRRPPQGRGPL